MAAQNTINLLQHWYPKGIDVTHSHDPCSMPTGRFDVSATLPPIMQRSPVQTWTSIRSMWVNLNIGMKWKSAGGFENRTMSDKIMMLLKTGDVLLMNSMKYLGSDQYIYQRPDSWQCFWKGMELAATGYNDWTKFLSYEEKTAFFDNQKESKWPDNPWKPEYNCGTIFLYSQDMMNVEAWMFQRVYSPLYGSDWAGAFMADPQKAMKAWVTNSDMNELTNVAKSWNACRFWFDTHTFGNAATIAFGNATAPQQIAANYPQFWPDGFPSMPNPYKGKVGAAMVNDFAAPMPLIPSTDPNGGFNESGVIIPPPKDGVLL